MFDSDQEYGISLPLNSYPHGQKLRAALIQDAQKTLPKGIPYQIISMGHKAQLVAWVYNPKGERAEAKVLEELIA